MPTDAKPSLALFREVLVAQPPIFAPAPVQSSVVATLAVVIPPVAKADVDDPFIPFDRPDLAVDKLFCSAQLEPFHNSALADYDAPGPGSPP